MAIGLLFEDGRTVAFVESDLYGMVQYGILQYVQIVRVCIVCTICTACTDCTLEYVQIVQYMYVRMYVGT